MYRLWKLKESIADLIDPERSIPNDAPHYRNISHIEWIESKGKYGCPGRVNSNCPYFVRGCHSKKCEYYKKEEENNS